MYNVGMDSNDKLERINRNLDSAGAKDACLACGASDLILDPTAETAILALEGDELDPTRAIPAVALICTNCGFVRLHSTLHLFKD
jgi:hypothetical protein